MITKGDTIIIKENLINELKPFISDEMVLYYYSRYINTTQMVEDVWLDRYPNVPGIAQMMWVVIDSCVDIPSWCCEKKE